MYSIAAFFPNTEFLNKYGYAEVGGLWLYEKEAKNYMWKHLWELINLKQISLHTTIMWLDTMVEQSWVFYFSN